MNAAKRQLPILLATLSLGLLVPSGSAFQASAEQVARPADNGATAPGAFYSSGPAAVKHGFECEDNLCQMPSLKSCTMLQVRHEDGSVSLECVDW